MHRRAGYSWTFPTARCLRGRLRRSTHGPGPDHPEPSFPETHGPERTPGQVTPQDTHSHRTLFHNVTTELQSCLCHRQYMGKVRKKVFRSGLLCPAEYLLILFVGGLDLEFVFHGLIDLPEVLHRGLKVHTQILATGRHCQPRVVWDSCRMEGGATFMAIVEEHTTQDKVLTRHHR